MVNWKFWVLKIQEFRIHRGVVNNITQTIQSIQQAVQEAELASGQTINEVTVGIAGQHIRSLQHSDYITRPNSDQVIDEADIERLINQVHKLVMLPGEEIIHVLPQEFKVDGRLKLKSLLGCMGTFRIKFSCGGWPSLINQKYWTLCKKWRLELRVLLWTLPLPMLYLVKKKRSRSCIGCIGGGTTDLAIFKVDY